MRYSPGRISQIGKMLYSGTSSPEKSDFVMIRLECMEECPCFVNAKK